MEPAIHSYLGDNLETIPSAYCDRFHFIEDSEFDLPLLCYQGVVIFPGETLPLRVPKTLWSDIMKLISSGNTDSLMTKIPQNYFGIVYKNYRTYSRSSSRSNASHIGGFCNIGTLVKVRAKYHNNNNNIDSNVTVGNDDIPVMLEGISRFEIINVYHSMGVTIGTVRVLNEFIGQKRKRKYQVDPFLDWVRESFFSIFI